MSIVSILYLLFQWEIIVLIFKSHIYHLTQSITLSFKIVEIHINTFPKPSIYIIHSQSVLSYRHRR